MEDGDGVKLENVVEIGAGDLALLIVAAADTEGVRVGRFRMIGVRRVGGTGRNLDDLRCIVNARGRNRAAAVQVAEHGTDAVIDQRLGDVDGLVGLAFVVERDGFDLLAEDAALGVPFVDRDLRPLQHRRSDLGVGSRLDGGEADLDRGLGRGLARSRTFTTTREGEDGGGNDGEREEKWEFSHASV
jgi:hypothetical protein